MTTLVVFESYFGNTEMVARAVAEVLGADGPVRTLRVAEVEAGHLEGLTVLVVGTPTRQFRGGPGIRAWLAKQSPGRCAGMRVAAFDTRVDPLAMRNPVERLVANAFGPAVGPIERHLQRLGGTLVGPAEGFALESSTGPLRPGETNRARSWARGLLGALGDPPSAIGAPPPSG